ncbi:MAG: hypothetical protein HY042_10920, partial [Spirochaetia bacterium]|nr:hypothetical protein [Spirochaetia bacterium]
SASVGGAPVGFTQITLRPHYHDSMSPDIGFAPHSEFLFLDTTIRAYASGEVTLERFHFLRIASQVPIDRISRSTSYIIDIGAETAPAVINKTREERYDYAKLSAFTSGDLFLMYRTFTAVDAARRAHQWDNMLTRGVTTFYGLATDAGGSNGPEWLFTAMPGVRYEYAEAIAGNVRAGPAFHLGAMFTYGRLRMELAGEYFGYSVMRQDDDYTGVFKTRFTLAKNHEIRLEARTRRQPGTHRGRSDVALSYLYFY